YVLRPDSVALAEERIAIPTLQLYGMAVGSIIAGPLLPAATQLPQLIAQQQQVLADVGGIWPTRPLVPLLYDAQRLVIDATTDAPPIREQAQPEPALVIELPGLESGMLQLTLSGDELIVRIGHYRRHVLLPANLRGISNIRATRDGDLLLVRRRS
ncbi:MAG TPA: chromosome partitioning protein, partial [Roseiflexaceae bacterium]|nr:chromosome partitioning protein [Roseiflexaceae bacterium]